ncbi:oxygen-independent coproporphyrinogen III oxidase [Thiohalomonas denitrificans]|uniref:Coproporphyrinogen-III oxidase n=1 Tax=Thiohalomonas denitrificans TaxID=415747 RepID=A0A1G5Q511_9GAMM|nr:oxygen-independent coproporphyrinogen III oxidase [Thiohalomonas denitrificans]SCZ56379.1 coproporphyrinogen III oxidase, anaerobic [Thiohalomonas denitrificans]
MTNQSIEFDIDLIKRYDKSGPRYTSYPTAVQFHEGFSEAEYRKWAQKSRESGRPLSLYFHIPFCDTVCFYCGCNKVVTKNRKRAAPYLERLHREIEMQAELLDGSRPVNQLHWGGGTPTFISHDEMTALMDKTRECFNLHDDDSGEYSIEIDPREVQTDTVALLRKIGFNRMSLGVQDFDPRVQKAVNRIQTEEQTLSVLEAARREGFKSMSIDLIYGLPFQSTESFGRTLDRILEISPDRLAVFNYAHLPELFKPQRRIEAGDLPSPQEKLDILQLTIDKLTRNGYLYIGMDHFAKPDDELAVAQRERTLYRNFQGYSTHADCDLVGLGSTSISQVGDTYSQNLKGMEEYYERIDAGRLAVFRGYELNEDDKLRRSVITNLICHFVLHKAEVEKTFGITFDEYFAAELNELNEMEKDGLLEQHPDRIEVKPAGKLLIRNICMVFDRYLREKANRSFSKVI